MPADRRCSYTGCDKPDVSRRFYKIDANQKSGGQDWSLLSGKTLCNACYLQYMTRGTLERKICRPIEEGKRRCTYKGCGKPEGTCQFYYIDRGKSAGGQDWTPLVGMVLCNACHQQYKTRGMLERRGGPPSLLQVRNTDATLEDQQVRGKKGAKAISRAPATKSLPLPPAGKRVAAGAGTAAEESSSKQANTCEGEREVTPRRDSMPVLTGAEQPEQWQVRTDTQSDIMKPHAEAEHKAVVAALTGDSFPQKAGAKQDVGSGQGDKKRAVCEVSTDKKRAVCEVSAEVLPMDQRLPPKKRTAWGFS